MTDPMAIVPSQLASPTASRVRVQVSTTLYTRARVRRAMLVASTAFMPIEKSTSPPSGSLNFGIPMRAVGMPRPRRMLASVAPLVARTPSYGAALPLLPSRARRIG